MQSVSKTVKRCLNEGSTSTVTLRDVLKAIQPYGWQYQRCKSDSYKFIKGEHVVFGHLKHNAALDANRFIDINSLDSLRTYFIEDFYESRDLELIKSIDWRSWNLADPLKRELSNIDPNTGKERQKELKLNKGQELSKLKQEKAIKAANELYKTAALIKITHDDQDSAFILISQKENQVTIYNTCRSVNDRRPLLNQWTTDMVEKDGSYYFGKDDMRMFKTKFYKVLPSGQLDKKVDFMQESIDFDRNDFEMI